MIQFIYNRTNFESSFCIKKKLSTFGETFCLYIYYTLIFIQFKRKLYFNHILNQFVSCSFFFLTKKFFFFQFFFITIIPPQSSTISYFLYIRKLFFTISSLKSPTAFKLTKFTDSIKLTKFRSFVISCATLVLF